MKTKIVSLLLCIGMLLGMITSVSAASDGITLPDLISDHMLIQQGKPIKLWGTAPAGETVTIKLETTNKIISQGTAEAQEDGSFRAELPAVLAGGPYTLTFSTSSSTKTVNDVLVGELWVQGGQSIMEQKVSEMYAFAEEYLPETTQNEIRLFIHAAALAGTDRKTDRPGKWEVATRDAVKKYSALGYSALAKLYEELDMPVGGICTATSGTTMSVNRGPSEMGGNDGGSYYNRKVAPLTQFNIRGIMWEQGESDRGNQNFVSDFKNLIQSWRRDWDDEDMPFVFATCFPSPMKSVADWLPEKPYIMADYSIPRLAQTQVYNEVENTAIAVSIDCKPSVNDKDDWDPGHPRRYRKPAGERIALSALGMIYGLEDRWSSPMYQSATVSGNTATITFSHAYDGLKTTDGEAPRCFMVADSDGKFYAATAEITGKNTLKLTCPDVSTIKQISYAIEKHLFPYESTEVDKGDWVQDTYPDVNLVNSENLPALPFCYEVTKVVEEKQPKEKVVDNLSITVPLNDTYSLPETIAVSDNGVTSEQNMMWSVQSINTKKEGTTTIYGLAENTDLLIQATVKVKEVNDTPIQTSSITKDGNKVYGQVELGSVQANRSLYLITAFYGENGTYLSSKMKPVSLVAGQTGTLTMDATIPDGAKTAKLMIVNQNLRPFLAVKEGNVQDSISANYITLDTSDATNGPVSIYEVKMTN